MPFFYIKNKGAGFGLFYPGWIDWTSSFIYDEITLFIALKIQQAAKISMVKLDCHFGQKQWLALKGHTHAGGLQHRQIICPLGSYRMN